MEINKTSNNSGKRCSNCGLRCKGMFCCEWCLNTYYARRDAHRCQPPSQPDKKSAPAA